MRQMRTNFIVDMHEDLMKVQTEVISNAELRMIVKDIRKFLRKKR